MPYDANRRECHRICTEEEMPILEYKKYRYITAGVGGMMVESARNSETGTETDLKGEGNASARAIRMLKVAPEATSKRTKSSIERYSA